MVYLITDGRTAGAAQTPELREVRTPYATLDEAQAQAEADLLTGRTPLRIVEGRTGQLLWKPEPAREKE